MIGYKKRDTYLLNALIEYTDSRPPSCVNIFKKSSFKPNATTVERTM